MKKALKFLLLLLLPATAYAEPFTILAKSGLNVRKAPNATSEKVASLPFGTVVDADIDYETDIGYNGRYTHVSEVIEGKQGFWMRITYGKVQGYIFSGFGLVGERVVQSTDINKEYRLLQVGRYCDPINYDPKLYPKDSGLRKRLRRHRLTYQGAKRRQCSALTRLCNAGRGAEDK